MTKTSGIGRPTIIAAPDGVEAKAELTLPREVPLGGGTPMGKMVAASSCHE
jgi:hypothetical protein